MNLDKFFVQVVVCYDCLFQGVISILKMFQELFITAKVLVLYKRSYLASFLSFVGNRSVTKFS